MLTAYIQQVTKWRMQALCKFLQEAFCKMKFPKCGLLNKTHREIVK